MRIQGTKRINQKIARMSEARHIFSTVNSVITNSINGNSVIPYDVDELRKTATDFKHYLALRGQDIFSVDKHMLLLMVKDLLEPHFMNDPKIVDIIMGYIAQESKIFDVKEFRKNPYLKNIRFSNHKIGDFELRYNNFEPYELDIYNVPKWHDQLYSDIPRISCFTESFHYPAITQESIESTWMSVSPNEVFTMEKAIANSKGKVLTLGCGMGYFAYMASLKKTVESVTIIEIDQNVIDLFETYILPQFEHKDKIKIIKADAIEFLNNTKDGEYDYCFADIWISGEDIAPYFAIKEIGRNFRKTKMEYWIEDSFGSLLLDNVYLQIMIAFNEAYDNDISGMYEIPLPADTQKRDDYVQKLLSDVVITKPEHIDYYMNPKNVIALIDQTDIVFE